MWLQNKGISGRQGGVGKKGAKIKKVSARPILDSRGKPTIYAEISTDGGVFSACVPSGASTGSHEAVELRDGGSRLGGAGVNKAVSNINNIISKKVNGADCTDQRKIDEVLFSLDSTPNKAKLGANSMLAVSLAAARAGAAASGLSLHAHLSALSMRKPVLPVPFLNFINGGKHAGTENDFQEHMIVPFGFKSFSEALWAASDVFTNLKKKVYSRFGYRGALVADEGGFAPSFKQPEDRLALLTTAIDEAGYSKKMGLALDCAASEFHHDGWYCLGRRKLSSNRLIDYYCKLVSDYKVVSIEDGLAEDDWLGWKELTLTLGRNTQLVGDDLLTTNPARIIKAIEEGAANALLLKVNQIGTLSEAIDAALISFSADWQVMVSHRSGETEDAFIADLAVGLGAGQVKFGSVARSERCAKYNRLLGIESELGGRVAFAGITLRKKFGH
ncbi:phosphopyruvate hydratase [Candidatus Micrarchaeota archaeon CG1_02_51_15]|nr:MAG: phosphopyruvate hydratase [Candidatus Micrarchaeota archaeon CG1_02_51_15]